MSFVGALFNKPEAPRPLLELSFSTDEPRKLIIGKTGIGGKFVFHGLSDHNDRNDNKDMTRVIVLAGHRCNRITRIWGDGELVRSTPLVHGTRTQIPHFREGSDQHVWMTFYDGRPGQAADSFLRGRTVRPVNWPSNATLSGCAYVVVTMRHDADVLTTPVDFIFEVEGARLYDRRKDSSVGGLGTQRWDNPNSWTYTNNPAVAADHYQLGMVGGANNDRLIFGMGRQSWQVPYDEFAANANVCDEVVLGEARYAANGVLSAGDDHKENITKLATAMAARPFDVGGRIFIRPQQARTIKLTLTDADLVGGTEFDLITNPGGSELVNTIRGTFRDPVERYTSNDYPLVEDAELISRDGRAFEDTLDLDLETSERRAQRLASIELEVQKRRDKINEQYMPIANVLDVGDWFERVSTLRGDVTKIYEVISKTVNIDLTVDIEARETDPSVTAFGADQARPVERPDPLPPLTISRPDPPISTAEGVPDISVGAELPSATITITTPTESTYEEIEYYEVEYGLSNELTGSALGIVAGQEQQASFINSNQTTLPLKGLIPGQTYVYRIRVIADNRPSDWSDYQIFTAPSVLISTRSRTADDAIALGGTAAQILIDGVEANAQGVADLVETFGSTASSAISAAAAAASAGASQTAQTNAEAARDLAETAKTNAETAEQSASAALELSVSTARAQLPSTFEDADLYFTDQLAGDPDTRDGVFSDDRHTPVTDEDGIGIRTHGEHWIMTKGVLPLVVGNTYRIRGRAKMVQAPTNGAGYNVGFRRLNQEFNVGTTRENTSVNIIDNGELVAFENTVTATQGDWDSGARFFRAQLVPNGLTGITDGDGIYHTYFFEFRDITSEFGAEQSAIASAASAVAAGVSETAAVQSANVAETSRLAADTARSNAESSESAASTSETNAAGSASAAATSASLAATSEGNADISASAAANSAITAQSSADDAESHAQTASTERIAAEAARDNAETSATASADSAATASASETASNQSATAAQTAQTAAETAEAGASISAGHAATSETSADGSAAAAAVSETNAAQSENDAGNSAIAAASSETAAATSATAAETFAMSSETSSISASSSAGSASASETASAASATAADGSAVAAAQSATETASIVGDQDARITVVETTAASLEGYASSRYSISVGANGEAAGLTIRTAGSGQVTTSDFTLSADRLIFEADGEVIWFSDTSGLTMNRAIRFIGGGTAGNPDTMYVLGNGFGLNNDLLEWFGPYSATLDAASVSNGSRAKDIQGNTYLNGAQEGASPITASETTLNGTPAEITSIGANGNSREVSMSYSRTGSRFYLSSTDPGNQTYSAGSASIRLENAENGGSYTVVHTANVMGTITRMVGAFDFEFGSYPVSEIFSMNASFLHVFTSNAASTYNNRTVRDSENLPSIGGASWSFSNANLSVSVFEAA